METSVCVSPSLLALSRTTTTLAKTTKRRTRCLRWYEAVRHQLTPVDFHVPALWRDLSYPGIVQELADAIFVKGNAVAISARLRHDIEAKALEDPSTMTWLQQRVALELRLSHRAGRLLAMPEFMLVIEQVRGRDTHLHGLIEAVSSELEEVRKAFRRACGEWPANGARQHQVKTQAGPDDGWVSYMLKDRAKTLKIIRAMQLMAGDAMSVTFNGKPYTTTQELRRRAQAAYEDDRAEFIRRN